MELKFTPINKIIANRKYLQKCFYIAIIKDTFVSK